MERDNQSFINIGADGEVTDAILFGKNVDLEDTIDIKLQVSEAAGLLSILEYFYQEQKQNLLMGNEGPEDAVPWYLACERVLITFAEQLYEYADGNGISNIGLTRYMS